VSFVIYIKETESKFSNLLITKCCQERTRDIRVVAIINFISGLVKGRLAIVI